MRRREKWKQKKLAESERVKEAALLDIAEKEMKSDISTFKGVNSLEKGLDTSALPPVDLGINAPLLKEHQTFAPHVSAKLRSIELQLTNMLPRVKEAVSESRHMDSIVQQWNAVELLLTDFHRSVVAQSRTVLKKY